ncbi:MAG TPA: hypothetical protein VG122_22675 [Gemmata sp.]|jgi:hypothetical protein|nr:hypothetical protein [Gemmata sp.]
MTLWHASFDLLLTTSSLTAAAAAKNLRLEVEAGREETASEAKANDARQAQSLTTMLGLGLSYRGTWDTSG